jgi:nitroreductase
MQRRNFIQLVGGGVVSAALVPLVGCSAQFPEAATQAWRGAPEGNDVRRWALSYAMLAPSAHNLQSWRVDLREPGVITLRVDTQRLLPQTDPVGRQVMVSQGTFLELLVMALAQRGVAAQVLLLPEGQMGPRLQDLGSVAVARVQLLPAATIQADPLFAQIVHRHTSRTDYDTARPISTATAHALQQSVQGQPVGHGVAVEGERLQALRTLCWRSAQVELSTPHTVMESIALTRVGPAEIAQHRDGISLNEPMVRVINSLGMFDRTKPPVQGSSAHDNMMARFSAYCQTAMGFVWLHTPDNSRAQQIQAGRAHVRLHLKAAELGLALQPMSQSLQEFPEMTSHYQEAHSLLLQRAAPKTVQEPAVQMLCRIGYPTVATQPAPRRALQELVQA